MLSYTNLQKGMAIILDGEPYEVQGVNFLRKQQRKPVVQAKVKNLSTGKTLDKTFRQTDFFEEAKIKHREAIFIYSHREKFWFSEKGNPKNRFSLLKDAVGAKAKFLKENLPVVIYEFKDKPINIQLPIKADYKVKEAPPGIKGDTAQGGTKEVILENGLAAQVPLFIEAGDIVRINTQTGEYSERVKKAK